MTPEEIESLKNQLRQTEALLKQEQGKRIAVERENHEIKRQAKLATEQAEALVSETQASLGEAAEQMKIALAVSQGIWAFGQMGRAYMARKAAAARVVFRETQACILMQQVIDAHAKRDELALKTGLDKMSALIRTVKGDGEAVRMAAIEASLHCGAKGFEKYWDLLASENNHVHGIEE